MSAKNPAFNISRSALPSFFFFFYKTKKNDNRMVKNINDVTWSHGPD